MIVLANGVFDVFHYGHLAHLKAATGFGNLSVAVTSDKFVNKGPGRPVFNQEQRRDIVNSLRFVHGAYIYDDLLEAFEQLKPDFFVKGIEYINQIQPAHMKYCDAHTIKIVFTDTPRWSSTALLHYYDRLQQGS